MDRRGGAGGGPAVGPAGSSRGAVFLVLRRSIRSGDTIDRRLFQIDVFTGRTV